MPSRNRAREAAKAAADNAPADRKKRGDGKGKAKGRGGGRQGGRRPRKTQDATPSTGSGHSTTPKPKRPRTGPMLDPSAVDDAHVRFVQPYEATKTYICPGCNRDIVPGVGHLVAVPPDEPDLRRHWHRGCWHNRHTRF